MSRWFAEREGWERASLIGALLAAIWILAFRASPMVLNGGSLSWLEVLGSIGGAFGVYFLVLWAWGIRFIFPTWREQRRARNPDGGDLLPEPLGLGLGLLFHLTLAGLEVAIEYLPRSIPFLTGLPARALRAAMSKTPPR